MSIYIYYPKGILNCRSSKEKLLIHLAEHLISSYLADIFKIKPFEKDKFRGGVQLN